jgi:carboxyl-terminal processing protease
MGIGMGSDALEQTRRSAKEVRADSMTPRNLVIMLLAVSTCVVCAVKANQSRFVGILNEALHIVSNEYVEPVEQKKLFEQAMNGMVRDLDENSSFIPESEYAEFEEEITNEFGGIGVSASYDEEKKTLVIASPMPDTPAIRAGLQPLDEIVTIDGKLVSELGEEKARKALRGAPGAKVSLGILSKGSKEKRIVEVQRAMITLQSVLGDTLLEDGKWNYHLADRPEIAYIRVTSFGEGTAEKVEEALQFKEKPLGIILDLRNNPGGLLDAATYICDLFLREGLIVQTRGRNGVLLETHEAVDGNEIDASIPVVVMVNGYSASASEIVAACLQDHRRAKVVGERSYGKGTVQNVVPLQGGRSGLRLTIANYWRPSGKNIQRPKDADEQEKLIAKGENKAALRVSWGVAPDEGWDAPVVHDDEERELNKIYQFRAERDTAEFQRFSSKSPELRSPLGNLLESDSQLRKAVECIDSMAKK